VTPMTDPSMKKMRPMEAREAPIALSTAISLPFSITTMTREPMMLNAATTTMSVRMTNMVIFSSFRAEKRFWFISRQSRIQTRSPSRACRRKPASDVP
jgi:hypothetical protein